MAAGSSASLVPPIVNPASLYSAEARRDATRIRIYNQVLNQIYNKIKAIARIPGNQKNLWYLVPEFIPGTPRFDVADAIVYIGWHLENAGYSVTYTHPNLLFISWEKYDMKYKTTESPWSQVMHLARSEALTASSGAPSIISPVIRSQPVGGAGMAEIIKRKTPIKKTVEFKPDPELMPPKLTATSPTVVSAMYSGTQAAPSAAARLPGQLSEKHVSFV